jgi:hypothetical protein
VSFNRVRSSSIVELRPCTPAIRSTFKRSSSSFFAKASVEGAGGPLEASLRGNDEHVALEDDPLLRQPGDHHLARVRMRSDVDELDRPRSVRQHALALLERRDDWLAR